MRRRILLVEDNEPTIDVVQMELQSLGYDVLIAKDGLRALEVIVAQMPDLVIVDIQLPKIDGFEVVRRIRADPAIRDIPLLAATAKALKSDEEMCFAAGCDGYIAKPFTHRQLEIAINRIFELRLSNSRSDGEEPAPKI